jgi:RNA polymerase sigma factor (sigma-70 family)
MRLVESSSPPMSDPSSLGEAELLLAWGTNGDRVALDALVRRYAPLVLGVCRRHCRSASDVEDAFQAVFMILAQRSSRIRDPRRLPGWLHAVAVRTAIRSRRQAALVPLESLASEPSQHDQTLEAIESKHELSLLDEELEALPERYRTPLVLHFLEGCTYHEVARRLGLSIGVLQGRLHRGKQALRDRLLRRGVGLAAIAGLIAAAQQASAADASAYVAKTLPILHDPASASLSAAHESSAGPLSLVSAEHFPMSIPTNTWLPALIIGVGAIGLASLPHLGSQGGSTGAVIAQNASSESVATTDASFLSGSNTIHQPVASGTDPIDPNDPFSSDSSAVPANGLTEGEPNDRNQPGWIDPFMQSAQRSDQRSDAIARALNEEIEIDFNQVPLDQALQSIAGKLKIGGTATFDSKGLEGAGLTTDEPITLSATQIRGEDAIQRILEPRNLSYRLDRGMLEVFHIQDSQNQLIVQVYPLDWIGLDATSGLTLIRNTVAPDAWDTQGGAGSITPLQGTADGEDRMHALVIRATFTTHRDVQRLLVSIAKQLPRDTANVRFSVPDPISQLQPTSGFTGGMAAGDVGGPGGGPMGPGGAGGPPGVGGTPGGMF